jgi:hypothetical protein
VFTNDTLDQLRRMKMLEQDIEKRILAFSKGRFEYKLKNFAPDEYQIIAIFPNGVSGAVYCKVVDGELLIDNQEQRLLPFDPLVFICILERNINPKIRNNGE